MMVWMSSFLMDTSWGTFLLPLLTFLFKLFVYETGQHSFTAICLDARKIRQVSSRFCLTSISIGSTASPVRIDLLTCLGSRLGLTGSSWCPNYHMLGGDRGRLIVRDKGDDIPPLLPCHGLFVYICCTF